MDLQDILKQLKSIDADADYTRRSRHAIIGGSHARAAKGGVIHFVFHTIAEGSAIALAGVLLFLVFAGFSTWNFISPFGTASLDPLSLHAEAEAIDIQVQLTNLAYPEVVSEETSTIPIAPGLITRNVRNEAHREAKALGITSGSASSSEADAHSITIDEALERLSE